jgi:antitoxin ParD1/3/4
MPTRNVVLTDRHEAFIHRLVESGRYCKASEVMREALRSLEQRETGSEEALDWLRRQVEPGLTQARQRVFAEGTVREIFDRINQGLDGESTAPA